MALATSPQRIDPIAANAFHLYSSQYTTPTNVDAIWNQIHRHIRRDVDSLLSHYLQVDAAELVNDPELVATRDSLAANTFVERSLNDLRNIGDGRKITGTKRELPMYDPLRRIFEAISLNTQSARKLFKTASKGIKPPYAAFPAFPTRQPDFVLVDCDFDEQQERIRWHFAYAILEVKCAEEEGPSSQGTMKQAADEARLHMNVHPFRMFSIVLIIHGSKFSIIVIDRGGVMYSPPMAVYDDDGLTLVFIAVIRQLCNGLDDRALGLDPTATKHNPPSPPLGAFPTYKINPLVKSDNGPVAPAVNQLITDGPPLWTSMSLLGRGSVVWRASMQDGDPNSLCIVKTAWRHQNRVPEFKIYDFLERWHIVGQMGIASFVGGGDVVLDTDDAEGEGRTVSVNSLRPADLQLSPGEDILLHRVILGSVGKPLWEYSDEPQLLRGVLAAVRGIRFLEQAGIVHRDISAGNVLLSMNDTRPGYEGFITDFEFAKLPDGVLSNLGQQRPGPEMTGTAQFMAYELLLRAANPNSNPVVHATHHDLESLVYALAYALFRKVYDMALGPVKTLDLDEDKKREFLEEFRRIFGRLSPSDIRVARKALVESPMEDGDGIAINVFSHLRAELVWSVNELLEMARQQYPVRHYTDQVSSVAGRGFLEAIRRSRLAGAGQRTMQRTLLTCAALEDVLVPAIDNWPA